MNRPQSVIGKAKELLETHGKEYAIKFFQEKINESNDIFSISGYETAIEWLELGDEGMKEKAREFLKTLKK